MWKSIVSKSDIGGVSAMITNQQYHSPGKASRLMYQLMCGKRLTSYAGKCIGPAWNLLPEDNEHLPELVQVEWLNTTCTLYRKEALPTPAFPNHFKGYSLMEDLTLSLTVGKRWKLYNARTARIYHDSQPGTHKNNIYATAKMELINRYYVMTNVLGRKSFSDHLKLIAFQIFGVITPLRTSNGWRNLLPSASGKIAAIISLLKK